MSWLMSALEPVQGVLLALALGLLIGVERGWSRRNDPDGSRVAGIRTFALLGLAGGLAGEVLQRISPVLAAILLGAAAFVLLIGYIRRSRSGDDVSATSTVVGIITLGVGLAAATGGGVLAGVVAAITTLVLSSRRQLHAWVNTLTEAEMQAIARFALIALAILPLLPDQAMGPFDAWNPRQIWMIVVVVSGFSFAGYVVARRLGASRGLVVLAAAGAMVSSTAVTAALANRLRKQEGPPDVLIAGIVTASAVMFLRVLILTAALAPFAFTGLALLVGPATALCIAWALWLLWRSRGDKAEASEALPLRNPFDLGPALLLAGLVLVLSGLARWLLDAFGETALATALALSGMFDVDSAIITMSVLPPDSLDGQMAGMILAGPVMLNTIVKAVIAIVMGGRSGWRASVPLLLSVATGGVALPLLIWNLI